MAISRAVALAALVSIGAALVPVGPSAQDDGITRTKLQQEDLSVEGHETIQVLVEFAPGAAFPRHAHPGEELVYVTEGSLEYRLDGQEPVILKAGEVLFIPYGVAHEVRNVGDGPAAELATYIVEKGEPLLVIQE